MLGVSSDCELLPQVRDKLGGDPFKDEATRTNPEDGHLAIKHLCKTPRFIKPLGSVEVFYRQERPGDYYASWD
jgi:hypothetical protein